MTKEEVLAMEPGRDLDAIVAKYVRFPGHTHPLEEIKGWCQKYSTDISAAWEVAEKLKDNFHFSLTNDARYKGYYVIFESIDGEVYDCDADTMPQAICKAALLTALEVTP